MISEKAKQAVDQIFTKAARANLVARPDDAIEIERLADARIVETPEKNIYVLTISSYLFRLLTVFHVDPDGATADYFTKSESGSEFGSESGSNAGRDFDEVFGEIGNLCCGAMNRDLGGVFVHLGMSTPHRLARRSVTYLNELKPAFVSRYRIGINGTVSLHATLCMCAYAPIDFHVDTAAATAVECEAGMIELF